MKDTNLADLLEKAKASMADLERLSLRVQQLSERARAVVAKAEPLVSVTTTPSVMQRVLKVMEGPVRRSAAKRRVAS